ncbi:hypothetical protein ACER0C_002817 [Sarotherodon galilaeus]
MADQEQKRGEEFLKTEDGFRGNALKIIMKMDDLSNKAPGSKHLVDEILHSIFFLGKINKPPFSPEDIFPDGDILEALMAKYPRPFQFYLTQLPRRSPFSCVLDMIVLQNNLEGKAQITNSLKDLIEELKLKKHKRGKLFLVSSTICISQKSKTDQNSKRYYGVSMSTNDRNPRKIVIAASCLSKWDEYVSGAVMTYYPNNEKKKCFDGTIEVPENIRCEAFKLCNGEKMNPCRSCHNLFGLNTEETKEWPYGNCAEAESLSNLLQNEQDVKNEIITSPQDRQKSENEVRTVLTELLETNNFRGWNGEFYIPGSEFDVIKSELTDIKSELADIKSELADIKSGLADIKSSA